MGSIKIKKSGFEDAFFVIAVVFAVCIFVLIVAKAYNEIKTPLGEGINSAMPVNSSVNVTKTLDTVGKTINLFDTLLPFILIGLFAFVLIGAAFYMNNPIMIFVGLVILAVAVLLGMIYANIYHQISASDEFSSTNAQFPIQEYFMKFLPAFIFILVIGAIVVIIWSRQGGSGSL